MSNGTTLMTTTLPTLVGAHVVSKSTETLFGKNGRRRATTRTARTGRTKSPIGSRKVYTGKCGGKYIMKKGRRVYI